MADFYINLQLMEIDPTVNSAVKIVAVGDPLVGKSCAITKFQTSVAPIERQSTIFDSSTARIIVDGQNIELSLWDTTGKVQYKEIRKSVYKDADIFLIFFSVINPDSLTNAATKWLPEVKEANDRAFIAFVGNKIDLRSKSVSQGVITQNKAWSTVEQELKCKYLECSAVTGEGLSQVFEYCVREHFHRKYPNAPTRGQRRVDSKGCCQIM